jgi:hypothetical protein
MNIDEARLMAYVDGELEAADAARVETAIAADPRLAAYVRRHAALRARLGDAYAGVLDQPVPERLLATIRGASSDVPANGKVVQLPRRETVGTVMHGRPRWSAREWTALAASLLLGVLLARVLPPVPGTTSDARFVDAAMRAQGELAQALEHGLAATPSTTTTRVALGLSFRSRDDGYCRSFTLAAQRPLAGLACRAGDAPWRVVTLAEAAPAGGGDLRQASSALPSSLLAEVDARMEGEPLDAGQERAARDARWR